jgi:hypothetical protein
MTKAKERKREETFVVRIERLSVDVLGDLLLLFFSDRRGLLSEVGLSSIR